MNVALLRKLKIGVLVPCKTSVPRRHIENIWQVSGEVYDHGWGYPGARFESSRSHARVVYNTNLEVT
jgi:hypothetical protein